jgi:hypothetical protein
MATTYRIGFQSVAAAASAAYAAFRAPTRTSRVLELGLACNAATASNISLLRNTAGGYAASTSTSVGQADLPIAAAGTSLVDTAWTTAPTVTAASRLMRYTLPATIGAGMVWTFPDPGVFVRSATATDYLVIWNEGAAAGSVLNGYIVWCE